MMRPIKFRGKRLDNGEWVYGHYADYIHPDCGIPSPSIIYPLPDCGNMIVAVNPSTTGQFTGLMDRHGTEIYEGDILERYNEQGITMHVNYFGSQFGCIQHWDGVDGEGSWYPLDNYCTEEWEVISNIHDNPELQILK